MSFNKVLNRPMFRKTALRQGVLKPINANTGVMVGYPTGGPLVKNPRTQVSTQVKPQSFFQKLGSEFKTSRQGIKDIMNPKSNQFSSKGTFGSGRMIPGLLGIEGIASTIDPYVGQYIKNDLGRGLVTYGLASAAALNPYVRAAGIAKFGYDTVKDNIYDPLKKRTEEYRKLPASQKTSFAQMDDAEMGMIDLTPSEQPDKEQIKKEVKSGPKPQGRFGMKKKVEGDRLTEADNESSVVPGNVDIDKVVTNNTTIQDNMPKKENVSVAEVTEKTSDGKTPNTTVVTDDEANKNIVDKKEETLDKDSNIKAADGTPVTSNVIQLAKQYRKELMSGQQSQAKLAFLGNLAAGLLSGKSNQGGIAGALEIFGSALGPAVNNYATIKLKENELSNEFMSSALELAQDEIDRRNQVIERPDYDGTPGMVQFTDKNGKIVNATGIRLKDSTVMVALPGQLDQFGRNKLQPLAPGSFNRFAPNDELDPKALDTLIELDQKYKAYQYGQKSVALIEKFQKAGKTGAGPVGRFNLFKGRLSEAMYDVTGMNMFTNENEARQKVAEYKDLLVNDWLKSNEVAGETDEEKRKNAGDKIDALLGDSVNSKKIAQAIGEFTGEADQQALSQLAINETVMVYALANSLKAKDRLTAKDIQMAKELVNIFPLLRGQKAVIRDLRSVNATILQDIQTLENTYTTALMGETATIKNYKRKYGIATSGQLEGSGSADLPNPFEDLNTEQLLNLY